MLEKYKKCTCCPRHCKIDRTKKKGFCLNKDKIKIARAALHYDEEPSISSKNGSGTIFFSGCNLKCLYCQNKLISQQNFGKEITIERLSDIMIELQEKKAHNINLVTPTPFVPSIKKAIKIAKEKGLHLPIIYNTSGYDDVDTLKELEGYIDIYLTDFKYFDNLLSKELSHCSDYVEKTKEALQEMYRQTGKNQFDSHGVMQKGILVRHLCLPTLKEDSKKVLTYLFQTYQNNIYLSIMNQYTPMKHCEKFPFLCQKLKEQDYDEIIDYALDLGIQKAYIQEGETAKDSYIPLFNLEGVEKE